MSLWPHPTTPPEVRLAYFVGGGREASPGAGCRPCGVLRSCQPLLIAHSSLRLPASCVPVPQGPFPQPLSGPLNRKCEAARCSKGPGGVKESIPRSFLSASKNSSLSWICRESFSCVAAPASSLHLWHLSSKPSCAGVTIIFLSPSPLGWMAWTVCCPLFSEGMGGGGYQVL